MPQQSTTTTRRALLAGAPAVAVAMAAGTAVTAATPDPIFAVIAEYEAAVQTRAAVLNAEGDYEACPTAKAWDKAQEKACNAEWAAFDELFETMPTTIVGVAALLEVLATDPYHAQEGEDGLSTAGWAYNNAAGLSQADDLMLRLADMLRTVGGGT